MGARTRTRALVTVVATLLVVGLVAPEPASGRAGAARQAKPKPRALELASPPLREPKLSIPKAPGVVPKPFDPRLPAVATRTIKDLPERGPEQVAKRDAVTEVFANGDGSETVVLHGEPVHYQPAGSKRWEKIDNSLVPDSQRPGWVRNKANSWTVRFGPVGAGGTGGVEVTTAKGTSRWAPELAAGAESVVPVVAGSGTEATVTYPGVWPGVDVVYTVTGMRVKERIVVSDAATAEFPFAVEGLGLSASPAAKAGSVQAPAPKVTGAQAGTVSFEPLVASDESGRPDAKAKVSSRVENLAAAGRQRMTVSVDSAWLRGQTGDGLAVVDPTVVVGPTQVCSYAIGAGGSEGNIGCDAARTGTPFPGSGGYARSVASWDYWPYVASNDVLYAGVWMNESPSSAIDPEWINMWDALNWTGAGAVANGDWARLISGAFSDRNNGLCSVCLTFTDAMHWWQVDGWFGNPPYPPNRGHLFGFGGDEDDPGYFQRFSWKEYPASQMSLVLILNARVPAPTLTAPKDGALVIDSMTPTLRWNPVTDPDGDPVKYTVKLGTGADGESGLVATSPELTTTEWQVPAGVLKDGQTYFWKVYANDTHSWTPSGVWRLTVDKRQGAGGLSPTDSFGGVTTNLVTGTPSISVSAPDMPSVGGGVGVDFMYNGRSPVTGLVGTYREDADKDAVVDATDPVKLVRTDSQVSFDWSTGSPSPAVPVDYFLGNWSGIVQAPAGNWQFGIKADDGSRIWIDGTKVLDRWSTLTPEPTYQTGTVPGGRHRIQLDYYEVVNPAYLELWVRNADSPNQAFIVPADWLSPAAPDMATGWTLQAADANASYLRANVSEGSVALAQEDGTVATFTKQPDGTYKPPEDVDDILAVNADGTVAVHDDAGLDYAFRQDGGLASVTSALDDRNPAAAVNHYDDQGRLDVITDPVSGRSVTLRYAASDGDTNCPNVPPLGSSAQYESEAGLLCKVSYWDGTSTNLYYFKDTDLLASVANPGDAWTAFSYDSAGRVVSMVSPLARDALLSGARTDTDTGRVSTVIAYASADPNAKVTSVTLPAAMQADQLRGQHSYAYSQQTDGGALTSGTATVTRAGVAGAYRTVKYDHRGRTVEDTDAVGLTTKTYWDARDLVYATETPDGLVTSTYYNARKQPTDVWGPAPKDWFVFGWYGVDLAVAKDEFKPQMAHAVTRYDEGISGTQVMWWNNLEFSGAPKAHNHDPGELADDNSGGRPAGVAADTVSARYTGDITFPTQGGYKLQICAGPFDAAWLYFDNRLIATTSFYAAGNVDINTCSDINAFDAGITALGANEKHQLRVDYKDFGNPDLLHLNWVGPGIGYSHVAGTALTAGYNLPTSTVDPDGKTTSTEYTDAATGIGPQHGLVTRTTVDPGGLNLSETNTYETVGAAGSFLRKLSHTLPAGASSRTTSTYYGNTEQVDNPCTAGSDPANQGGRQRLDTAADPDGTGAQTGLKRESVYDASGRAVATRVGTEPWTCTTYDARGRATKVDSPTFGGQAARTVTTNYNADPDGTGPKVASPMVTTVTDPAGTIQSETDLLGRVIAYKDVWANTTTFSYDQAGRETGNAGPVGTIVKGYDNADRLKTLTRNNQELATVAYDPANGRVTSTAYPTGTGKAGNGTTGTFAYDGVGRPSGVTWTGPGGAVLTKDEVSRSLGGDIVDQKTDGNDHHAGNDYVYDAAGRLTEAFVPAPAGVASRHVCYEFGTTTPNGCGAPTVAAVPAGKNTNRTRQMIQGGATSTYTYDDADRLTSTTESGVGTIAYDAHGNTTTIFGETHAYDAADRHVSTTKGTKTVTYVRDATDRIVARKVDGTVVARYGSTGSGDAPDFTTDASNVVQEVTYSLPGGALLTTRGGGNVWSYPNLHGDVAAVANQSGAKQGATKCYDPFGNNLAGGIPDNSAGNFDYGWLGKSQRPLEAEPTLQPVIEMGARQYSPLLGRFIEVDPVEGGSANDYDYVTGEPINSFDLDGTFGFKIGGWKVGDGCPLGKHKGRKGCRGGSVARAAGHGIRSAGGVLRRNWGAIAIVGAGFGCAAATVTIVGGMACGAALGAAINSAAYWTNGRRHTARGWLSAGLGGAFMGAASAMGSSRFVALRGRGGAHMSQLKPWW